MQEPKSVKIPVPQDSEASTAIDAEPIVQKAREHGRNLIVVDSDKHCPADWTGYPVVDAETYLSNPSFQRRSLKVINLCSHPRKLSLGYYVSLLAEARGQRVIPEAKHLLALEARHGYVEALEELGDDLQKTLGRLQSDDFTLSVYFGENVAATHHDFARKVFRLFQSPMLRVTCRRKAGKWNIQRVQHLGLGQVPEGHHYLIKQELDELLKRGWRTPRGKKIPSYELAILHNPKEPNPPSNPEALRRFVSAGADLGVGVSLIQPSDYPRLLQYDALLIRETTALDNHTIRFASKAERKGLAVIDDPTSIRRCCNKVFMEEALRNGGLRTPETLIISRRSLAKLKARLQTWRFPCVIKIPHGAFSLGVFKAESEASFLAKVEELFDVSEILLAQEYLPTDFDWRIGVLNHKPLYACKYYMSRGHWQIYNHGAKRKSEREGEFDCVPFDAVPGFILEAAVNASKLFGNSLYGVDLKEVGGKPVVIEVNDNPNIDAGIEDQLAGEQLYRTIVQYLLQEIERIRHLSAGL